MVFGDDGDEVVPLALVHGGDALDRQVVALGGPAGKDDLARVGPDQGGDLGAGLFDGPLGALPEKVVPAGGVAVVVGEVGEHRLHHARVGARRGVVIEV